MKHEFAKNEHLLFPWSFLFFRALLLSNDYKEYCTHKESTGNSEVVADLKAKYQEIDEIYKFWGNVNDYTDIYSSHGLIENRFLCWCGLNGYKLLGLSFDSIKIVPAWHEFVPRPGEIYFTVSDDWEFDEHQQLFDSSLHKILDGIEEICDKFPASRLNGIDLDYKGKLAATEQRLDAYQWKVCDEKPDFQCLQNAIKSNKKCWMKIKGRVEKVGRSIPSPYPVSAEEVPEKKLKTIKGDMGKFAVQGSKLIELALQGKFPDYKEKPTI